MKKIRKVFEQFDDYELEDIFGKDDDIKVGDKVRLINRRNALYDGYFRDTKMEIGDEFTVTHIKEDGEYILIRVKEEGWQFNLYNSKNFKKA